MTAFTGVMPDRTGLLAQAINALTAGGLVVLAGCVGADGQQPVPTTTAANYVAPATVDTTGLPGPVQPIFYRHDVHAGQYKMDCRYCHFAAETSPRPGIPSVKPTCMGCHVIVGSDNPEVGKLREAAMNDQPVEWLKVHDLPPFVHFPHMRHVKAAGITCQTCHGPVQEMARVYQYSSLKMGWCLDCHKKNKQTTDCTACHY